MREDGERTHASLPIWPGSDYISCVHILLIRTQAGGKCSFLLDSHFSVGTPPCGRGTGVFLDASLSLPQLLTGCVTSVNFLIIFYDYF